MVGRGHSKRKLAPMWATLRGSLKGSEGKTSLLPFLSIRICSLKKYGSGIGVGYCPFYQKMEEERKGESDLSHESLHPKLPKRNLAFTGGHKALSSI